MHAFRLRYLASAYVDADSIIAEQELVIKLLENLNDKRLTPAVALEQKGIQQVHRIAYHAPKEGLTLILEGSRFNYAWTPTQEMGKNIGSLKSFCEDAGNKISVLLNFFGRKSHRLATVQEGYLKEMDEDQMQRIATRLLKLPPTFQKTSPFEWDWRVASLIKRKFSKVDEEINTIIVSNRRNLIIKYDNGKDVQKDLIRVDFDINTSAKNTIARFGSIEADSFFKSSVKWHKNLETEFLSYLGETVK